MKIGIISPAEIAIRRFLPALQKSIYFEFAGVAISSEEERFTDPLPAQERMNAILGKSREKAKTIVENYGGIIYDGYHSLIEDQTVEAVYIPLPPALHFRWAKLALESGKHVLVEKPATTSEDDSNKLIEIADQNSLALHENYMFIYHKQIVEIQEIIKSGEIGDIRLYRISFGFPRRSANDFRYKKTLGGGALLDAGGYTIKYARYLLGPTAKLVYSNSNFADDFEVDLYGSAALINEDGVTAQIAFGMDNEYKCDLEVWGSKGCLSSGRILTAPEGYVPTVRIRKGGIDKMLSLSADDTFLKSITIFQKSILDIETRKEEYKAIIHQAHLIEEFKEKTSVKW